MKSLRTSFTSSLVLIVFVSLLCPMGLGVSAARAQGSGKSLTVTGKAAGTDLKAQDEAKRDAKRNAVSQACGEYINAQTGVQDFEVKRDRILSTAAGYITDFKVQREWNDGQISYCEAFVTVSVGKFIVDWAAMFEHIREDVGNPRCVVVITEDNDIDDPIPPKINGVTQSKIENFFVKNNVQLMDKTTVDGVKKRDFDLAATEGDSARAAAMAAGFKADVLVMGQAEARRGGLVSLNGHDLYQWDITLTVRVFQADSGQMLASNTYKPIKPFMSTSPGASGDGGFTKLAEEKAPEILNDVAVAWKKKLTSYQIYEVQFDGCSRSDFTKKVTPALLALRGVQQGSEGVKLREFVNNTVNAQLYWAYDLNALANELESLSANGLSFEIVEQSGNRVRAKVITTMAPSGSP